MTRLLYSLRVSYCFHHYLPTGMDEDERTPEQEYEALAALARRLHAEYNGPAACLGTFRCVISVVEVSISGCVNRYAWLLAYIIHQKRC